MKNKPSPATRVRNPVAAVREKSLASQAAVSFPIIGIGASASDLEALEQLLARGPADKAQTEMKADRNRTRKS